MIPADVRLRDRVVITVCFNLASACSFVGGAALTWVWLSGGVL